jgi:hypothetical protein
MSINDAFADHMIQQVGQQMKDIEDIRRALASHSTVSCTGKTITIAFDDHDAKDLVMDFLTGCNPASPR